jgi:hypothetical protein
MGLRGHGNAVSRGGGGFKEAGRSRRITGGEFAKVKEHAHFTRIDAMDLA